ncbi:MAG: CHRD domain-containing protein [Thermoproteota archaeon]|nr:CHRD domain-containing protein [Thermoproteota archaeon]
MTQKNTFSKYMFPAILSLGIVAMILNSATVQAQEAQTFSATLSGKDEVPPTKSIASGTAKFLVNENDSQISYLVNLTGLKKITQAHIHNGTSGQNGDVLVNLSNSKSAKNPDNPEIQLTGTITKVDLQGPLKGRELSDLLIVMRNGQAYVNAHTEIYPKGAIRGQIMSGS